ncbi:hypothetical protein BV379_19190 [Rhodovulum sulfidophilum]|nr:hypothetical protein BV379_19190 [Rhodovulum sulfidophilum]
MAGALAVPERHGDTAALAAAWADQTVALRLAGAGHAPPEIGAHLRRSFLGAMGRAASPAAEAGRPCDWDPPCALDVFRREQLRGPKGDGLPKPYVLAAWSDGPDLAVTLRIFGMAIDWAMAAAEALVAGIGTILPWGRVLPGAGGTPVIAGREIGLYRIVADPPPNAARLVFLSPMDATGTDAMAQPWTILSRALRRADALSRWNGMALDDEVAAAIAAGLRDLEYDVTGLRPGRYASPNRHGQARQDPTLAGQLIVRGDLSDIWPVLRIAERAHIGRHAVEGLGRIRLETVEAPPPCTKEE